MLRIDDVSEVIKVDNSSVAKGHNVQILNDFIVILPAKRALESIMNRINQPAVLFNFKRP